MFPFLAQPLARKNKKANTQLQKKSCVKNENIQYKSKYSVRKVSVPGLHPLQSELYECLKLKIKTYAAAPRRLFRVQHAMLQDFFDKLLLSVQIG